MTLPQMPNRERWATLPFCEQMANLGSEVGRTAKWVGKHKDSQAQNAFVRAMDLYYLTIEYGRRGRSNRSSMLKELLRSRALFAGAYLKGDYNALLAQERYFSHFAKAVALRSQSSTTF